MFSMVKPQTIIAKMYFKKKKTQKSTSKISVWSVKMNYSVRAFTYIIMAFDFVHPAPVHHGDRPIIMRICSNVQGTWKAR